MAVIQPLGNPYSKTTTITTPQPAKVSTGRVIATLPVPVRTPSPVVTPVATPVQPTLVQKAASLFKKVSDTVSTKLNSVLSSGTKATLKSMGENLKTAVAPKVAAIKTYTKVPKATYEGVIKPTLPVIKEYGKQTLDSAVMAIEGAGKLTAPYLVYRAAIGKPVTPKEHVVNLLKFGGGVLNVAWRLNPIAPAVGASLQSYADIRRYFQGKIDAGELMESPVKGINNQPGVGEVFTDNIKIAEAINWMFLGVMFSRPFVKSQLNRMNLKAEEISKVSANLGVKPNASSKEISKAILNKMKKFPDAFTLNPSAESVIARKEITDSYNILRKAGWIDKQYAQVFDFINSKLGTPVKPTPVETKPKLIAEKVGEKPITPEMVSEEAEKQAFIKALTKETVEIPVEKIQRSDRLQKIISGETERVQNIRLAGEQITTPVRVTKNPDGTYEVVDGEHRIAQAIKNGDKNIKAVISEPFIKAEAKATPAPVSEVKPKGINKEKYTPQELNTKVDLPGRPDTTIADLIDLYPVTLKKENIDSLLAGNKTELSIKGQKIVIESMIKPEDTQTKWIIDQIYNNEDSNEGMKKYLMTEGDIPEEMADKAVELRNWMQKQPKVITHNELAQKLMESQPLSQSTGAKAEFKVGDMFDPQKNTNMVSPITIREITGNTLKFIDSKGTEFYGMQKSLVRDLIKGGSWKRVEPTQTEKVKEAVKGKFITAGQDIKDLDAQIRTIKKPTEDNPDWVVEIGLQESLGEQGGDIVTWDYTIQPTLDEIRKDILDEYKRTKADINKEVAMGITVKSGRDEMIEGAIDKVLAIQKETATKPEVVTPVPQIKQPVQPVTKPSVKKKVVMTPERVFKTVINRRSQLPVLGTAQVKDGRIIYTDLETSVTLPTDLPNGLYNMVGKDFVKTIIPDEEFPVVPKVEKEVATIETGSLSPILKSANLSASTDETSPLLTGVKIDIKDGMMTIATTDGYRLYLNEVPVTNAKNTKFTVPVNKLSRVIDIMGKDKIQIKEDNDQVSFSNSNGDITVRKLEGKYPAYEKIFPQYSKRITVSRKAFLDAAKAILPYSKEGANILKYEIKDNQLILSGKGVLREAPTKTVPVTINKTESISTPPSVPMKGSLVMPVTIKGEGDVKNFNALNNKFAIDVANQYTGNDLYIDFVKDSEKSGRPLHFSDQPEGLIKPTEVPLQPEEKMISPSGIASAGGGKIGDFEKVDATKTEESNFKLFEKVNELVDKYAKTIGESYLPRKAIGAYYPDTENLRINGINNLSVAAHEITHFLDHAFDISSKIKEVTGESVTGNPIYDPETAKVRKEITDIYEEYYPGGKRTHKLKKRVIEGFATLLEKYTEEPTTITNKFPNLVKEFLKPGGQFYQPVIGDILKDLREIVAEYQGLPALDKIGARISGGKANVLKKNFMNLGQQARTFIADAIYPIELLDIKSGKAWSKESASLWTRFYNNSNQIILNNIRGDKGFYGFRNGEFVKLYDYNYKTLIDGLAKEKTTDSFAYYLVARDQYFHYQEVAKLKEIYENLKQQIVDAGGAEEAMKMIGDSGMTLWQEYKMAVAAYKKEKTILDKNGFTEGEVTEAYLENKDRFNQESEMFDTLVKEDIEFLSSPEVQLVNPDLKVKLQSTQGYASLKRQFHDDITGEEEYIGAIKVGKTRVSTLIGRKGSERTILNPVYNALTNHAEATKKGLKQIVYNKIGNIAKDATFPTLFQKLQLKVLPDTTGRIIFPQERDPHIIMSRINYKRVPILTDNLIKQTIDEVLTHQNIHIFEQLLLGTSRFFTKGTTGLYPQFALSNYAIDQVTAAAQTMNKYVPIYSPLKELFKAIEERKGDTYKYFTEYMALGGEHQTFVGWQDMSPNELFSKIGKEKNGLVKVVDALNNGMDILAIPSKYSEIATRATEYIRSRKSGKSQLVALEEAGRVTAPFHHLGRLGGGRIGQTVVKSIPFFNPAIQVLDQSLRSLESPAGRTRFSFVVMAVTAALLSSFWLLMQKGTKEQKDLYNSLEPEELAGYIWLPNPAKGDQLIKMKIPQQMGIIGVIANMAIANQINNAQYTFGDFTQAGTAFLPQQLDPTDIPRAIMSWIPQILKPAVMVLAGIKDYPKILPLESQTLKNLPPGYRYNESTSEFAKWLGQKINVSPIKIDYLITGYFGRVAGFMMGKKGIYNPFSNVIRNYYFSSGRQISNFYDLREKNDDVYKEIIPNKKGQVLRKTSLEERSRVKAIKQQTDDIADLLSEYRKLDIEKSPITAAKLREQILVRLNKLNETK